MGTFSEDIQRNLGAALRDIGATFLQHTRNGEGWKESNVCFYSASEKIIAISHAPRDGFTCFIGDARSADLSQYETWDTLWHLLGMDSNVDTDEGLAEYIRKFPTDGQEYMKFLGTCLVKYFGQVRSDD